MQKASKSWMLFCHATKYVHVVLDNIFLKRVNKSFYEKMSIYLNFLIFFNEAIDAVELMK